MVKFKKKIVKGVSRRRMDDDEDDITSTSVTREVIIKEIPLVPLVPLAPLAEPFKPTPAVFNLDDLPEMSDDLIPDVEYDQDINDHNPFPRVMDILNQINLLQAMRHLALEKKARFKEEEKVLTEKMEKLKGEKRDLERELNSW